MLLKVKQLHPKAELPAYAKEGDAAMDIRSVGSVKVVTGKYLEYSTGLAIEIPKGYVGLLFPRSSISNYDLSLCNAVGVLDSGYRGEITFRFRYDSESANIYTPGDKIGQLLVIPHPTLTPVWFDSLLPSERGSGGYGSSGL